MTALTVTNPSTPDASVTERNLLDRIVTAVNGHAADIDLGFEGVPQDGAVTAAKLAAAVQAKVPGTNTLTAAAQAATHRDVTIQLKDIAGANVAAKTVARVWLSDAAAGAPTASAPDVGFTVQTGVLLAAITANKVLDVISDATGVIVVRIDHAGADTTWFVNVAVGAALASSAGVLIDN